MGREAGDLTARFIVPNQGNNEQCGDVEQLAVSIADCLAQEIRSIFQICLIVDFYGSFFEILMMLR